MAGSGAFELGSVIAGYRIDELIGRGGMGEVYRTTNVALGRIYALKVLAPSLAADEQFRERFRREMRIAASLHHPNVVAVHYAGEAQGMLFFVMDFVPGTDLHAAMRKSGPFEPDRATALLTQLADALDAAHRRGLVHRDVKPANVLITVRDGEERAYLTDFGLAKQFDATSDLGELTRKGDVLGTVDYMSPEQITGGRVDARSDIYALGCVFFRMLTGHVPYECDTPVAAMFAHLHNPPPQLTGALRERYPEVSAVIEKATAKDPDGRYLSAGDFARDAAAALAGKRYMAAPTVVATGEATPVSNSGVAPQADVSPEAQPSWPPPLAEDEAGTYTPRPAAATAETRASTKAGVRAALSGWTAQDSAPRGPPSEQSRAALPGGPEPGPGRQRLGRYRWALVAALVCIAAGTAAAVALSSGGSSANHDGFGAVAGPVPTNRVTGSGTAMVRLKGDVATVTVDVHGLVNQLHWMHFHGGTGTCPTAAAAQRKNGHLFVSASVGDSVYGPPVTSLTLSGDTSAQSHLDPTRYEKTGDFRYTRTVDVGVPVAKEIRNGLAVIVVHGINYDGKDVYDNSLGPGAEKGAPALCGLLSPARSAAARAHPSRPALYTASLGAMSTLQAIAALSVCEPVAASSTPPPRSADAPGRRST